jgi:hypothetical protein
MEREGKEDWGETDGEEDDVAVEGERLVAGKLGGNCTGGFNKLGTGIAVSKKGALELLLDGALPLELELEQELLLDAELEDAP